MLSQTKDIDYEETFPPTANFTSIRISMQLAAQFDLIMHQMDAKTAYLNAPIDCEIFKNQQEGFDVPSDGEDVFHLVRPSSLYGIVCSYSRRFMS